MIVGRNGAGKSTLVKLLELNWNFGNGFDRQLRLKSALAEVANQEAKLEGVKLNLLELLRLHGRALCPAASASVS